MKRIANLMFIAIALVLLLTNCKKSEDEQNEFLTLKSYMVEQGLDLDHMMTSTSGVKFVMGATTAESVAGKYIMDIRSAADFATGHIEGATNVAFADILTAADAAETAGKKILVVCYTGQTACYATTLLRLAGHPDTQALKWGMSGWSPSTDKWTANVSDVAKDNANWTTAAAPAVTAYGNPVVITSEADGAAMLEARVKAVIAEGFKGVSAADVMATPTNYFINNYFSEADYTGFGHVAGAYRISPLLLSDGSINNLDPAAKVVTYCYTGQTSAIITAYLRVLGYDAYSLKFGMNGLYNSNSAWTSNQWGGDSKAKDFPMTAN